MEKLLCKGKSADGRIIIEIINEEGKAKRHFFRGVRCGLSWPSVTSPAYYCLVGQLSDGLASGKYPLRFLKEGESLSIGDLLQNHFDEMGIYSCWEVFSEVPRSIVEDNRSYIAAFASIKRERNLQTIKLLPAPFYQNYLHGVSLIKEWVQGEALYIPKETILHEQLRTIKVDSLQQNPENSFYAINALRYVVGAFETSVSTPSQGRKPSIPVAVEAWS